MSCVLVVDDNRDCADSACLLLRLASHDARAAYSGEQGLALAAALRPRLVLLDLAMPRMGGGELARRLRALPGLAGARLVALTGLHPSLVPAADAALFDRLLYKPAEAEELRGLLVGLTPARRP